MGFINSNNQYGMYQGQYCSLGLYDSDTDLVEVYLLPENKRIITSIDCVDVITDEKVKQTIKVLYDKIR